LPEDPALWLEYLYSLNLFETISFSSEDTVRTKQYQEEAARIETKQNFRNEGDFLKSLNMVCKVEGFSKFNTPRAAQLSQRSNQFNLRTIRYTEADIAGMANNDHYVSFCFSLKDRFGDNGLICVVVLEKQSKETLFINTWFMSCRVLKRSMEEFTLNILVEYAMANGFKYIMGEFIPTTKNKMVENLYINLGFKPINDTQRKIFVLDLTSYRDKICYINKE
jgi:FkbH-like protein